MAKPGTKRAAEARKRRLDSLRDRLVRAVKQRNSTRDAQNALRRAAAAAPQPLVSAELGEVELLAAAFSRLAIADPQTYGVDRYCTWVCRLDGVGEAELRRMSKLLGYGVSPETKLSRQEIRHFQADVWTC